MSVFERACEAFKRARSNEYSSFYRDFYRGRIPNESSFPRSENEWHAVPLLAKEDILRCPYEKRVFIPRREVTHIRCTSGTSQLGVLCMPRNMSPLPLSDNPPVRGLNLVTPFYHTMLLQTAPDGRRSRIIATDRTQLPATARIIAQIKADSLLGPPSLFIALGTYLRPHGETDSIRFIQLSGERCSTLQMRALRAMYRNASITIVYASAETQGLLASSPLNMMPEYPRAVEVLPDFYIEIIDEQGAPVTHAGATGEMVVTMLAERLAFPLIRYRTGDIATVLAQENDKIVLDIGTRVADDVVRIDGGEIHLKELERAILAATDSRVLDFEAIVTEEIRGKKITPRLSIALIITKGANKTHEKDLAKRISAELRVNQNRSYADGAAAELYAPLVCTIADPESSHESKRRHLVDKRV